jgi:ankyrin repeat protein
MSDMRLTEDELAIAIENGDLEHVAKLIESPSFDFQRQFRARIGMTTATVFAAIRNQKAILQMLFDAGANINDCDRSGTTPCHAAVRRGHTRLVAWLIERGADLTLRDSNNRSMLFMSASFRTDAMSLLLIEAGASLDDDIDALCRVAGISVKLVRLLLARNINVRRLRDNEGRCALHYACELGDTNLDVVEMLVREVGIDHSVGDHHGKTPAHICAWYGFHRILRRLIDFGADVDRVDEFGVRPLMCACARSHSDCVQLLVAVGAAVHVRDCMELLRCSSAVLSTPEAWHAVVAAAVDAYGDTSTARQQLATLNDLTLPSDDELVDARRRIAATQLALVRERAFQVCVGLAPLDLAALQICEILLHACGNVAAVIPFHQWWKIATTVKHF